jgi:integrase
VAESADAGDLKSLVRNGRVGSSPTSATGFLIAPEGFYHKTYHKTFDSICHLCYYCLIKSIIYVGILAMSKRGMKATFIEIGNKPIQDVVKGHLLGLSYNKSNNSYYTMIPKELLPKEQKRSKRKWLGSDLQLAVAKFWALITCLKGEDKNLIYVDLVLDSVESGYHIRGVETPAKVSSLINNPNVKYEEFIRAKATESEFIDWLKKEIQNPKELARKTGIPELAEIGVILAKDTHIKLSELLENYLNKKKKITHKEASDSKKWFETFCKVIDCSFVDDITLKDIHSYEDFIHSENLAAKTIQHRINKISTIFKYNTGRFYSPHLIQVHNWLKGLDRPEADNPYNPSLMKYKDFKKLYAVCDKKWKSIMLLGLNSAMYPIDLSRLKKSNIDFNTNTTAFRRGKKGKVLAVSTLWDRTVNALQDYLATRKDNLEYVFLNRCRRPYKSWSICDYFGRRIRKDAGVDKTVVFSHLRDTFSTLAQDSGYTIEQINLVLGHINKGMQDRYAVRHANELTGEMCKAVEERFFEE